MDDVFGPNFGAALQPGQYILTPGNGEYCQMEREEFEQLRDGYIRAGGKREVALMLGALLYPNFGYAVYKYYDVSWIWGVVAGALTMAGVYWAYIRPYNKLDKLYWSAKDEFE